MLYSRNCHNTVNQLYFNKFFFFLKAWMTCTAVTPKGVLNGSQESATDHLHLGCIPKPVSNILTYRYLGGILKKDVRHMSSHFEKALNGRTGSSWQVATYG